MFTKFLDWLARAWTVLQSTLQTSWNYVVQSWTWLVGLLYAFLVITQKVIDFVWSMVVELMGMLDKFSPGTFSTTGANAELISVINTFFPLQELFVLLTTLSLLMGVGLTYRLIKSWIPGLA